ncbi:hypothetical protein Poli38472_000301 [Pythium oligandrum]|uniref:Elicitin n=1 Tax=Pythium oligandrum TaxID=41045 RepID=A0A8K1CC13_PYTOL|nr:hypothetical protein Poli38472_000301 [Pythium oligandrum]|eukprot:TMW60259.1 hypothetical protein Poli38472_000301 [Pythium oligandrum]
MRFFALITALVTIGNAVAFGQVAKIIAPSSAIPVATPDSLTFRKVDNIICNDDVTKLIYQVYTKNRPLFDLCTKHSQYQIFPYSGQRPTQEQIHALVTSRACTSLFTACVLADLPQCDISDIGLKAVTELLLKTSIDEANGKPTPTSDVFHDLLVWRTDVNLAQAAGVPYGNDSTLYAEFSKNLFDALTTSTVRVKPDHTIVWDKSGSAAGEVTASDFDIIMNTTSGSLMDVIARVQPMDNSGDGSKTSYGKMLISGPSPSSASSLQVISGISASILTATLLA